MAALLRTAKSRSRPKLKCPPRAKAESTTKPTRAKKASYTDDDDDEEQDEEDEDEDEEEDKGMYKDRSAFVPGITVWSSSTSEVEDEAIDTCNARVCLHLTRENGVIWISADGYYQSNVRLRLESKGRAAGPPKKAKKRNWNTVEVVFTDL